MARELEQREYVMFSFGATARTIDHAGASAQDVGTLVFRTVDEAIMATADEMVRREVIGRYVGPLLNGVREQIIELGQIPLDIAVVNLRPPKSVPDTGGISFDNGGIKYINDALAGNRWVVTDPAGQADILFAGLDAPKPLQEATRQELAYAALEHLRQHYVLGQAMLLTS